MAVKVKIVAACILSYEYHQHLLRRQTRCHYYQQTYLRFQLSPYVPPSMMLDAVTKDGVVRCEDGDNLRYIRYHTVGTARPKSKEPGSAGMYGSSTFPSTHIETTNAQE